MARFSTDRHPDPRSVWPSERGRLALVIFDCDGVLIDSES